MKSNYTPPSVFCILKDMITRTRKLAIHSLVVLYIIPLFTIGQTNNVIAQKTITQTLQVANAPKGSEGSAAWVSKPGSRDDLAFIANAGQYNDALDSTDHSDILYCLNDGGMNIYFTKHGVFYRIMKKVYLSDEQWDSYVEKNNLRMPDDDDKGKRSHAIWKRINIKMSWAGSNSDNVEIIGEEKTHNYFNFYRPDINKDKIIGNVAGYKKLLYKNVYPGIDVEYIIHPESGIKYSLILHQGADPSAIKMEYSNADLSIDKGDVILSTEAGKVTDHKPFTYVGELNLEGKKVGSAFEKINNNTIGFKLDGNRGVVTETTIIDPWTNGGTGTGLSNFGTCIPEDVAVDGTATNVIVNGNESNLNGTSGDNITNSYSVATGALNWSLDMYSNYEYDDPQFQGDVQADNAGNIYMTPGIAYNNKNGDWYNTVSLNSAGNVLRWGSTKAGTSANNDFETWTLTFDCGRANLYQSGGGLMIPAGGGTYNPEYNFPASEPINIANGSEGALYTSPAPTHFGEIIASCYSPRDTMYELVADSNVNGAYATAYTTGAHNYIILVHPATGAIIGYAPTGYQYQDGSAKSGWSTGSNGIGASCFYVYTTDGLRLDQRSLQTGNLIKRVAIAGGDSAQALSVFTGNYDINGYPIYDDYAGHINSGIAFDSCGDVYVGGQSGTIYEYDENLNLLTTITIPGVTGAVYDIAHGADQKLYVTGGSTTKSGGFVAQVNLGACNGLPVAFTGVTCASPNSGTATANPQFAGPPFTYIWSGGAAAGKTTQTVTGLSAGTYTVTATGSPQCPTVFRETATVTIPSPGGPTASITSSTNPTCTTTGSATASASGGSGSGYTYAWAPSGGNSATANGLGGGTFTVTVTDGSGCTGTTTVTLPNPVAPTLTVTATSPTICQGQSTQITASGATGYTWSSPSGGLTNTTFDTTTASPSVTTTYSVVGTFGTCTTATQTVVVNVNASPTVNIAASPSASICSGGSATLNASGGSSYVWSDGSTTSSITVSPTTTTTYTVTGKSAAGCSNSSSTNTQVITVTTTPTVSVTPPSPGVCPGGSINLTASGATTYLWNTGSTTDTIWSQPSATTTYTVTGTNGTCTDQKTVIVTVGAIVTNVTASSGSTTCSGVPDTLTATGATNYVWYNGSTNSVIYVTPQVDTTYWVIGTSGSGCSDTGKITLTVNPTPTLTVSSSAVANAICAGTSAVLTAGGASTYLWTPGPFILNPTYDTTTVDPNATTTYQVVGTTGTCKDSSTIVITVNPLPTGITASASSLSTCSGRADTLSATGATTYVWNPGALPGSPVAVNPATSGWYTVTGTASGCSDTASVYVTVNITPTITISLSVTGNTLCPGQSVTLTANGGAATYQWSNGATSSSITITPTVDSIYSVIASNGVCNDTSAQQPVNIYPALSVTMVSDSVCFGKTALVSVSASGGNPGYSYSWNNGATTGVSSITVSPLGNVTSYTCSVTDACGTTVTDSAILTAFPAPNISFSENPKVIPGGQFVGFVNTTTNANAYAWTFGNGSSSAEANPVVQYLDSGMYFVTLIASNQGCADTLKDTVFVTESIFIPNVFTPNGDGQNDVFHVTMTSMKTYSLEIFNRWGQRVFITDSPDMDWDGRSEGGIMESDGTYYYEITSTDYVGRNYKYHGYLQLISGGTSGN
jgi:gliding motility-associated-like protein